MNVTMVTPDVNQTTTPPSGAIERLVISAAPHIRVGTTVPRTMLWVVAALMPAVGIAVMLSGLHAMYAILLSVAAASATEWVILTTARKKLTVPDGSAAITGLLLALSLPSRLPLWMAPAGSIFAIALVKMTFGGTGRNFLNPAMTGRAFLTLAFPALFNAGAVASGESLPAGAREIGTTLLNFLTGYQNEWMGGASVGALLIGAILLWCLRIIDFALPLSFMGSAFMLFWCTDSSHAIFSGTALLAALFQVMGSGLLLGAFFIATDPVTSPTTARARLLFGAGCGILTFLFQKAGPSGESIMLAILLMNFTVPYMDRYLMRRSFNAKGKRDTGSETTASPVGKPVSNPAAAEPETGRESIQST